MKRILFLGILGLVFMAADCEREVEPTPGEAIINFKGVYDSEPLVMFAKEYDYEAGMKVKLQLFQFYISNLELVSNTSGVEQTVPLSDVELISFKEIVDETAAQQGINLTYTDIPDGKYTQIRFGLGLTEALNSTNPSDYTPPHPLDDHYWSAALGYVFTKIEGNADLEGNGEYTNDGKLTFHSGHNSLYQELTFPIDMEIVGGTVKKINFSVDLHRVLDDGNGNFIDFREVTQDHTNNPEIYEGIANRLATAIAVQ